MRASHLLIPLAVLLLASAAFAHGGTYKRPRNHRPGDRTPQWIPPGGVTWEEKWRLNRERIADLRRLQKKRVASATPDATGRFFGGKDDGGAKDDRAKAAWDRIIAALLEAAHDGDRDVATGAIIALGKSADPRAIRPLMKLVRAQTDSTVNEAAALALGMAGEGSAEVREFLCGVLADLRIATRTRAFAALGLGLLGDAGAIPCLFERVAKDRPPVEKKLPLAPQGRLPARAGGSRGPFGGSRAAAKPAPSSEDADVAVCSMLAIGLLREEMVVPDLVRALRGKPGEREPDARLRAYCAAALGKTGSRRAIPPLVAALRDKELHVRRQAALSLGLLARPDDKEAIRALVKAVRFDSDLQVQADSAFVLGEIGASDTQELLFSAYRTGFPYLHECAALGLALLGRNGTPKNREWVVPFLRTEYRNSANARQKSLLAICLGILGDRKVVDSLIGWVRKKEEPFLRPHAAFALGLIGDPKARPVLREALAEKGQPVLRREAALALALLADSEAKKILLDLLKTAESDAVRGSAAVALGRLADLETALTIVGILENVKEKSLTRAFAAVALGLVVDRRPEPCLSRIGDHLNTGMAVPAIRAVLDIF